MSWRRGIVSVVCQRANFFWPKWRSWKISLHQWRQKLRTLFSVKMKHLHFRRTGLRNRRKKPWWWLTYCDKVSKNISCLIKCGKLFLQCYQLYIFVNSHETAKIASVHNPRIPFLHLKWSTRNRFILDYLLISYFT